MSEKFDTSWFDLKKYDVLVNFDLPQWYKQLSERRFLYGYVHGEEYGDFDFEDLVSYKIQKIKENPVLVGLADSLIANLTPKKPEDYSFNTPSRSVSTSGFLYHAHAVKDWLKSSGIDFMDKDFYTKYPNVAGKPFSFHFDKLNNLSNSSEFYYGAYFSNTSSWIDVNLTASNEMIMQDFKLWLEEYRKFIDCQQPNKPLLPSNAKQLLI